MLGLDAKTEKTGAYLQEDRYRCIWKLVLSLFAKAIDHGENDEMLNHWIWMSYFWPNPVGQHLANTQGPLLILLWLLPTCATPVVQNCLGPWDSTGIWDLGINRSSPMFQCESRPNNVLLQGPLHHLSQTLWRIYNEYIYTYAIYIYIVYIQCVYIKYTLYLYIYL